ncbi:unnamed protein product [Scytosiphon promiscuus]
MSSLYEDGEPTPKALRSEYCMHVFIYRQMSLALLQTSLFLVCSAVHHVHHRYSCPPGRKKKYGVSVTWFEVRLRSVLLCRACVCSGVSVGRNGKMMSTLKDCFCSRFRRIPRRSNRLQGYIFKRAILQTVESYFVCTKERVVFGGGPVQVDEVAGVFSALACLTLRLRILRRTEAEGTSQHD